MKTNKKYNTIENIKTSSPCKKTKLKLSSDICLKDAQLELLQNLSKSPIYKVPKNKFNSMNFDDYINKVEDSLEKYHLTYKFPKEDEDSQEEIEKGPNEKYMDNHNIKLIKQMYLDNKILINKGLVSRNDDSNLKVKILQKYYPNPYQSLGVIKHNYVIYDELSKGFLYRQSEKFLKHIEEAQKHLIKYKSKMPKIHVTGSNSKNLVEIPVVDMTTQENNKKEKITALPPIPQTGGLRLFCYYRYPNRNLIEGREQFAISILNNNILVSGGITANMNALSLWLLNCEKLEWKKIITKNLSNNRYGHTALVVQNKLYIFGGKAQYINTSVSQRLEIYNINDGTFTIPPITKNNPEPRRNHIAEIIGSQMLIFGGINDSNQILNDCYLLTLNPLKWNLCNVNKYRPGPKIYGHSSCLVVPREMLINHKFSIYSYPELELGKTNNRIKEKGLYIFGGKSKEGITNNLWILLMGKKPVEWILPETKGKPPSPRYLHSMNFYEKGNYLILHGGRNDSISENSALNDTFVFDVENFEWMEVELYSQLDDFKILNRCGHQSRIFANKLIILGGMNNNNYLGSTIFIINLDFYYSINQRTYEQMLINQLEKQDDQESKIKINKLKQEIKKNQLGLVTNIVLPEIK